jgi:hypothetical protein
VSASSGWEFGGGFAAWMKETGSEVKTVRLDEFGFIVSLLSDNQVTVACAALGKLCQISLLPLRTEQHHHIIRDQ